MKLWQHAAVWTFYGYMGLCIALAFTRGLDHAPTTATIAMVALPFILGPLALLAIFLDIMRRFPMGPTRQKWVLLTLLLWPSTIYYYSAHGRHRLPAPAWQAHPLVSGMAAPSRSSGLSTTSMICGIVSLIGMCIPLVIPVAVVGIVCGHRGLSSVRGKGGKASGRASAVAGLWLGYISLIMSSAVLAGWIWMGVSMVENTRKNSSTHLEGEPGYAAMQAAEQAMRNLSNREGQGNTPEAAALATDAGQIIAEMQQMNRRVTQKVSAELLEQPPITYCYLGEDSCVLIVSLRFSLSSTASAEKELKEAAWGAFLLALAKLQNNPAAERTALVFRSTSFGFYEEMYFGRTFKPQEMVEPPTLERVSFANGLDAKRRLCRLFAPLKSETNQ